MTLSEGKKRLKRKVTYYSKIGWDFRRNFDPTHYLEDNYLQKIQDMVEQCHNRTISKQTMMVTTGQLIEMMSSRND